MLALIHALRALLTPTTPTSRPARYSRVLRGPNREPIGTIDDVYETPDGIQITARLTPPGAALVDGYLGQPSFSISPPVLPRLAAGGIVKPHLDGENRRVAIADSRRVGIRHDELHAADPRPDLERLRGYVRALERNNPRLHPALRDGLRQALAYVEAGE